MTHKIRKQVMDLAISSRLDAFKTQHLAGHYYYRCLLPALEKVFDSLSVPGEYIQIEQLEIDLGVLSPGLLQLTAPTPELETHLRQQIQEALRLNSKQSAIHRVTQQEHACMQWLFYMEHGALNWNSIPSDEDTYTFILQSLATNYALAQQLRRLLLRNRHALRRIVHEHPESFLLRLIEIISAMAHTTLPEIINELAAWLHTPGTAVFKSMTAIRHELWQQLLFEAARQQHQPATLQLATSVVRHYLSAGILHIQQKDLSGDSMLQNICKAILQENHHAISQPITHQNEKETKSVETFYHNQEENPNSNLHEIWLVHAGLVLVHPFLGTLFNRLELVAGNRFKDGNALHRALHLLHYIATGREAPKEYELTTPKVLCGMPVQESIAAEIVLTKEEKQEADTLLSVVIEKWEKLKNVSIAALQENFLQRSGKLYTQNNTTTIQVENGSLDVLLDFLPWTLSMIKLPWMKELLRITWR